MSKIFLITAPSGTGKTTIAQKIAFFGEWTECISHTTRPMREGEVDGKTYYFVNKEEFMKMYVQDELAELVEYDGNNYGISKAEIERVTKAGRNVFIIVEYNGYLQIKEQYPDAIGIFIYMSKEDCLINMLSRGDIMENATKRISTYEDEMKNRHEYDYVIKNVRDKFDETVAIVRYIVRQHNKFRGRY